MEIKSTGARFKFPWPQGIIEKIGVSLVCGTDAYKPLSEDQEKGLMYALEQLKPTERDAILMHYREHLPIRELVKKMGRTYDYVVMYMNHGMYDLRGKYLPFIRDGYAAASESERKTMDGNHMQEQDVSGKWDRLRGVAFWEAGLSARTSNCLERAGYRDLADLADVVTNIPGKLPYLRNFGRKSQEEAILKLEEYSVDCIRARAELDLPAKKSV